MLFYPVPNTVQIFTHCFLNEEVEIIKRVQRIVYTCPRAITWRKKQCY